MTMKTASRLLRATALLGTMLASGCVAGDRPAASQPPASYDLLITDAMIVDGTGSAPYRGELAVRGERIAYVGPDAPGTARQVIDADGRAVAPGFINMLAWSGESLIDDGTGESSLRQGITLEVIGEGSSMGPLTDATAAALEAAQGPVRYPVSWRSLDGYFKKLESNGIAYNIASYVGAATLRANVVGFGDERPDDAQLAQMQAQLRDGMEDGALGVASALIYPPGSYADRPELTALARQAGACGGIYATHMRSEGDRFLEALDEAIGIGRDSGTPVEVFHLKVGGTRNFAKMPVALSRIQAARDAGLEVGADMYVYAASAAPLTAALPPSLLSGGTDALLARLADPETRAETIAAMRDENPDWENLIALAGGPEKVMLALVASPEFEPFIGQTIAEVAQARGNSPEETVLDIITASQGRVAAVYFTMSPDNLRQIITRPFVAFDTDGIAISPDGPYGQTAMHPRTYGTFARVFAQYVRDEKLLTLEEAVHRMTGLSAERLSLPQRGLLRDGYAADVVIFDPETIQDHATFLDPHRFATGVDTVIVNGGIALRDGEPTGAMPGKAVRGRAWRGYADGGCRAEPSNWP